MIIVKKNAIMIIIILINMIIKCEFQSVGPPKKRAWQRRAKTWSGTALNHWLSAPVSARSSPSASARGIRGGGSPRRPVYKT